MFEGEAMSTKVMIVDDSLMVREQVRKALDGYGVDGRIPPHGSEPSA